MPVRLLHTSDWHLGHELHDVDRAPEHQQFLRWLVDVCEAERVHGLLVAGDVFDVSNPSAAALATWADFLVELWRRMPAIRVVAIGGNHDSAHRLEMTEPFHAALERLHVLGAVPRARDGALDLERAIVRVEGDGESALVAAIPFLRPADVRASELDAEPSAPVRRVIREVVDGAGARRRAGEAIVAMGHLFVAGGAAASSERTLVGGVGAVPPDVFPPEVVYAALGHLHRAQTIAGRIRYSGPPLPLAFDEAAHAQQVTLVTLTGGALAEVRDVEVPQTRRLLRIPADGFRPMAEVVEALAALPEAGDGSQEHRPLLEVRVLLEGPEPALRQTLDASLAGKDARLVRTQIQYAQEGTPLADAVTVQALGDLDPVHVFKRRWARQFRDDPPPELLAAYAEVLDEARGLEEGR